MPRRPRLQFPGAIYHVMSRGNRKKRIFDDDTDRRRFFKLLSEAVHRYQVRCLELCLMRNHYHLLLEAPRGNLSSAMKHINGGYAQSSNRRHRRTGHVFEGRFRSIVIEPGPSVRRAARYIVMNPVIARYVKNVGEYPWSTYRATAGLAPPPPFLHVEWTLSAFGAKDLSDAQRRYRDYVRKTTPQEAELDLEALAFGSPSFIAAVREVSRMEQRELIVPLFSRALMRPTLVELFADTQQTRGARDSAVYEAHVNHGYTLSAIARFLGLHRSTCSLIFRRLEGNRVAKKKKRA